MDNLIRIGVDGDVTEVDTGYESIKAALDGATITHLTIPRLAGFFLDDEGLLNRLELNWVASLMAFQLLYGPVVMVAEEPDEEGDSQPPNELAVQLAHRLSHMVKALRADAAHKGQDIHLFGDPDTLPPPQVLSFGSFDEMQEFLFGGGDG